MSIDGRGRRLRRVRSQEVSERRFIVKVDQDLCVGNAMCRATAPKVFVEDANGLTTVADSEAESLETVLEAADNCPVAAISVEDAETGEPLGL
jgi:ferredoxin